MPDFFLKILLFSGGLFLVSSAIFSAVRIFVLPRATSDWLVWRVFWTWLALFRGLVRFAKTYHARDNVMAMFAPVMLVSLPAIWLTIVIIGYTLMLRAVGVDSFEEAFRLSGSSLLTLGFAVPSTFPHLLFVFSEGMIGLIMTALMIAYLPTIYSAFSKREAAVSMFEVRAGTPPMAVELFRRFHNIKRLEYLDEIWHEWEIWFTELEETHTSLMVMAFFRSPHSDRSWITAAGTVLDAASLSLTILDKPTDMQAALVIRSGYLALRQIASSFGFEVNDHPLSTEPISISREEFDEACAQLRGYGITLKADLDEAWRNFAGWRVNYDQVLLQLANFTMAPYAPWSSDRSLHMPSSSFGWRFLKNQ